MRPQGEANTFYVSPFSTLSPRLFEKGAVHFRFDLDPTDYAASLAPCAGWLMGFSCWRPSIAHPTRRAAPPGAWAEVRASSQLISLRKMGCPAPTRTPALQGGALDSTPAGTAASVQGRRVCHVLGVPGSESES